MIWLLIVAILLPFVLPIYCLARTSRRKEKRAQEARREVNGKQEDIIDVPDPDW